MEQNPVTSLPPFGPCSDCGGEVKQTIAWFQRSWSIAGEQLCDACWKAKCAADDAAAERVRFEACLRNQIPEDYTHAEIARIPASLRPALSWVPAKGNRRLGLIGEPGAGKTMTVAALLKNMNPGIRFRWTNGNAARQIYVASVTGEKDERRPAQKKWNDFMDYPLLVLDDVDKGNFTDAWCGALFDLLETRNGKALATIWTANLGPGQLAEKFAKCGDPEQARAIERRLCQSALILQAKL